MSSTDPGRGAHRPALPGAGAFNTIPDGPDPADVHAAAHRVAHLLVRGPHQSDDAALRERVLHLADTEGLGTIAELWAHAPADTLSGCLWRLYLLRTWVHRQPVRAAREFAAGRAHAAVHTVVAGVPDPPGPTEVVELVDRLVSGIVLPDLDIILDRAAAFAHLTAVGRSDIDTEDPQSAARLLDMAAQLRHAAALERSGDLS